MKTSTIFIVAGAIVLAFSLLALQIIGGLEYTEGGSLYTRASMIAAMIALACLPVFIEVARCSKERGVAVALFVAFLAFLTYSLPATVGRTGEIKEAKIVAASDGATARAEIKSIQLTMKYALPDMLSECEGAPNPLPPRRWPECRRKRGTVTALQERMARLKDEAKQSPVTGDSGSESLAWATMGVVPATVWRKGGVIGFAIGLDIAIWALIWFTSRMVALPANRKPIAKPVSPRDSAQTSFPVDNVTSFPTEKPVSRGPGGGTARKVDTQRVIDGLKKLHGTANSQDELADETGFSKGHVSKIVQSLEKDGVVRRELSNNTKKVVLEAEYA